MGSARSGTTLLDIVLGNAENIFSSGELNRFTRRNGRPPQREDEDPTFIFWDHFKTRLPGKYFDLNGKMSTLDSIVDKCEHFKALWKFPTPARKKINPLYPASKPSFGSILNALELIRTFR